MNSNKKIWNLTDIGIAKVNFIKDTYKLKHGMFAAIPILCKGKDCPYAESCIIPAINRTVGERCPVEISAIISRFDSWCNHFGIDSGGEFIDDEDLVDATLIRDLVDLEVQMLRAENKIALDGDFIKESVCNIDNKGNAYYEEKVGPAPEFKLALLDKRYKVLQLLNSTRKDKAKKDGENIASESIGVFKELNEKLSNINLDDL